MNTSLYGLAFTLAWFVFAVPTAVFLLRAYGRTKMSGFIWLLMALVVWPFIGQGARLALPMLASAGGYGIKPIMMMNLGITVVSGILLLVAVIVLDRELGERMVPPSAAASAGPIAPPPPTDLR